MQDINQFGIRHIRRFAAVASTLHFRRASEHLGIAQPVLSRSIQHLEAALGVALFVRNNRSVRLTDAGEIFLKGSLAVLDLMEDTVADTIRMSRGEIGHLRIGYTDFAIGGVLPELLTGFRRQQPGITLHPEHGVTRTQLHDIDIGKLDIGFVTGPIDEAHLEGIVVQHDRFVAAIPGGHRLASRDSLSITELADDAFVMGPSRDWEHFHRHLRRICNAAGFKPTVVQEAFNSQGILGLVACGMGVTILTESAIGVSRPGLCVLPLVDVPDRLETLAVWRPDPDRKSKQAFVDFVAAQRGAQT